ncbi:hypothetical protein Tco_0584503 [Tanacetum coccineum]
MNFASSSRDIGHRLHSGHRTIISYLELLYSYLSSTESNGFIREEKAQISLRSRSKRAGGKKRLMKEVRSSSHVSIVPSLSSSSHVFASPVSDRGNIIRTTSFSVSLYLNIRIPEICQEYVYERIGLVPTIELVSFTRVKWLPLHSIFLGRFRNSDSEPGIGRQQGQHPHCFIVHMDEISQNIKKVMELLIVKIGGRHSPWVCGGLFI